MICLACDVEIRGEAYAHANHSPLCRKCCFELDALSELRSKKGPRLPKPPLRLRVGRIIGRIKEMLMLKKLLVLVAAFVLVGASTVLAQDAPPDYKKLIADSITALVPIFTLAVLWLVKLAWSKIPAAVVVFAAPVVGILGNFLLAWVTGQQTSDPIVAALLGMAGTYLREILSTIATKGLTGGITVTKTGL